jgi:hypothetical protein
MVKINGSKIFMGYSLPVKVYIARATPNILSVTARHIKTIFHVRRVKMFELNSLEVPLEEVSFPERRFHSHLPEPRL